MRAVSAPQMREMDRRAIEDLQIPGMRLMEAAGAGAARVAREILGSATRRVVVLCGKGNNGGDGFVIARILRAEGHVVEVLCAADPSTIVGDAATALASYRADGAEVLCPSPAAVAEHLRGADLVIDALLGTGLSGPVADPVAQWIAVLNKSGRHVLAVDIPSGLCADRGVVLGAAVRADVTVTFALPKLGLLQYPGAGSVGRLVVVDIGIPAELTPADAAELLDADSVARMLPVRAADAHKGDAGRVLLVAGSPGLTGAACLAARAACRAGAGLVTVAAPADLCPSIEARLLEAMTWPLTTCRETLCAEVVRAILERAAGVSALAVGPGLGRAQGTPEAVRGILDGAPCPVVVDADGLLALPGWSPAEGRGTDLVLTPHPGEMATLLGVTTAEVQADRPGAAREAARRYGATVVLKGARSLIASADGRLAVNPTGHEGMASGGMGDVLTGAVAALLAQGRPAYEAACAGVFLHGWAAELAAEWLGGRVGTLAGDVIDELPRARESVLAGEGPCAPVEWRPLASATPPDA